MIVLIHFTTLRLGLSGNSIYEVDNTPSWNIMAVDHIWLNYEAKKIFLQGVLQQNPANKMSAD